MSTLPQDGGPDAQADAEAAAAPRPKPRLVFFYSVTSGRCRRLEASLARVLQRRQNHETFDLVRVSVDRRPDIAERFGVDEVPTLFVIEGRRARKRIVAPQGYRELEAKLQPWLR